VTDDANSGASSKASEAIPCTLGELCRYFLRLGALGLEATAE
jgi:hypothetical protein